MHLKKLILLMYCIIIIIRITKLPQGGKMLNLYVTCLFFAIFLTIIMQPELNLIHIGSTTLKLRC